MQQKSVKKFSRASILGYPVDLVTLEEAIEFTNENIKKQIGIQVATINPEMIMQGNKNPALETILKKADLVIPDGVGIIISLKKLGICNVKQLPGIEFSQALIENGVKNNFRLGFIGSSKEVVDGVVKNLTAKYPEINIVFANDGFFNQEESKIIVQKIKEAKPDVLFVALGVPKQELWIEENKQELLSTTMVGVGGSFDVWADKIKRAPLGFRKLGLEWFYRLITQPSRFNRMFPTLPLFFIKVFLDKKNTRKEY